MGAGSQLQAVSFLLLSCWTQKRKPLNQMIKECALWQQPQNLGSHMCAQILFTETPVTWGGTEGDMMMASVGFPGVWRRLQLTPRYVLEVLAFKIRK